MKIFLQKHIFIIVGVVIFAVILLVWKSTRNEAPTWTTDTVSTGTVRNITSVSGSVDAIGSADLTFPTGGMLESISVTEGDFVTQGKVLATLVHNDLRADAQDAYAALLIAQADRDELVNGIRSEARDVSKTTAEIASDDLARVTAEQNDRVENAYRTLLSNDLEVRPVKNDNADTPPTITGTYTCSKGTYTLNTFGSASKSGYSYRLSGIESGTFTAYTESAAPLGTCGLMIQFADGVRYGNSTWTIEIPNTQSSSYVTNLNAYTLALTERTNAITAAKQKLTLAEQHNTLDTAAPRSEALARENARVLQAEARLAVVQAQIKDHILVAPFDGTITNIEAVVGEAVGTTPIITMVSENAFALTALVPEIDITKIAVGQKADIVFDARQDETFPGTIIFISPLAKEIDGVSYFEAKLTLDESVNWLKSGLNADIDIILESHENVTRIPKRYLMGTEGSYTVLTPNDTESVATPITVNFIGNDGFVEISGLGTGSTIIAP